MLLNKVSHVSNENLSLSLKFSVVGDSSSWHILVAIHTQCSESKSVSSKFQFSCLTSSTNKTVSFVKLWTMCEKG